MSNKHDGSTCCIKYGYGHEHDDTVSCRCPKHEQDYLDRFQEVADGLGLERTIANKIANFIHYEVQTAKKHSRDSLQNGFMTADQIYENRTNRV